METPDFSKLCRLCLSQDRPLFEIFSQSENVDPLTSFSSKIMACVGIEVEPGENVPDKICKRCLDEVENWVKFKELCDNANALLIQYYTGMPPLPDEVLEKNLQRSNSDKLDIPESSSDFCLGDVSLLEHDSLFNNFDDSREENQPSNESFVGKPFSSFFKQNGDIKGSDQSEERLKEDTEKAALKEINRSKWREKYSRIYMRKYGCEICSKVFTKFTALLQHDRIDHVTIIPEEACNKCGRLFISKHRLEIHFHMKHRVKTYECDVCGLKSVSEKSLKVHKLKHSGRFRCNVCGLTTSTNRSLQDHLLLHADSAFRPFYTCDFCKRVFMHSQTLKEHLKSHMTDVQPCYRCDECSQTFTKQSYLQKHKDSHSTQLTKSAMCEECGAVLKNKMTLYIHKLTHAEKKHTCLVCDKVFSTKNLLTRHMLVHGAKPYRCTVCSKSYNRADTLAMHIKTHQNSRHVCDQCDQVFTLKRYLKRHVARIHRKEDGS